MGPVLNVQPFVSACLDLHRVVQPWTPILPMGDFLTAARAVESSLSPKHIPGFPENRRGEIRSLLDNLEKIKDPGGVIPLVFAITVIDGLRNMGLFPPLETLQKPEAVRDLLMKFLENPADGANAAEGGAQMVFVNAPRTLHYTYDQLFLAGLQAAEPAAPTLHEQALAEAAVAYPLVDPVDQRLLIEGGTYLRDEKRIVPSINPSPYRILREIDKGGNSTVYLAVESGTNRNVAVKVVTIRDEARNDELFERFAKEIEYQATFRSPKFVQVYAHGRTAQGNPFIVMEYCERGSLAKLIKSLNDAPEFDLTRAIRIASQAAAAAAEAHDAGIVHRDIKPDNYFVTEDGDIKLGDCGLAEREALIPKGRKPEIVGTPGFIAPETAVGHPATKGGDVWALGVTLYQLFTGVFCFPGPDPASILRASCDKQPVAPSIGRPERKIPKVIDDLIMKCIEKSPERRYQDARELLYDLLTADARTLIAEAEDAWRQVTQSGRADDKKFEEKWRDGLQEALRELNKVYDRFPHPKILLQRLQLNFSLHAWAKKKGDEELMRMTAKRVVSLAEPFEIGLEGAVSELRAVFERPGTDEDLLFEAQPIIKKVLEAAPRESRAALAGRLEALRDREAVQRKSSFHIRPARLPKKKSEVPRMEVRIDHSDYRAKFFEFKDTVLRRIGMPEAAVTLNRGLHSLRVSADGCVPLNIPLPVRPGHYGLRVPLYTLKQVPDPRAVIVPAGPAAARTQEGSFSELFDESSWRFTTHDVAFLPLRTNGDWLDYLQKIGPRVGREGVRERLPRNWMFDPERKGFIDVDNRKDILMTAPVTHILPEHAEEYLNDLATQFGPEFQGRVRHPKLNEWKRLMRGNNTAMWPWGDASPMPGVVCFRFPGYDNTPDRAVFPPPGSPLRDVSPFSVPDKGRIIAHVASNVQKFLHVSDPDDRARIAAVFGVKDAALLLSENIIVAGTTYRSSPITILDILDHRSRQEVGDCGILPVIELDAAEPSPSLESLRQ